jgi:hypothetical protein
MEATVGDLSKKGLNSTNATTISKMKSRLQVFNNIFFGMFVLSLFFGGPLIHFVHPHTGLIRAEIEGQVIGVLFVALSVTALEVADRIGWGKVDPKGPKSLSEALRK